MYIKLKKNLNIKTYFMKLIITVGMCYNSQCKGSIHPSHPAFCLK